MKTIYLLFAICLTLALPSKAQVDIQSAGRTIGKNQLKIGLSGHIDILDLGLTAQYFRDFHRHWGYSVAFRVKLGSGPSGFEEFNAETDFDRYVEEEGLINYEPHLESAFALSADGIFHFRRQKGATVFRVGVGPSFLYYYENNISTVQSIAYKFGLLDPDRTLMQTDVGIHEYTRFIDIGLVGALDYHYYLNDHVFAGVSGTLHNYFVSYFVDMGFSIDFGVHF